MSDKLGELLAALAKTAGSPCEISLACIIGEELLELELAELSQIMLELRRGEVLTTNSDRAWRIISRCEAMLASGELIVAISHRRFSGFGKELQAEIAKSIEGICGSVCHKKQLVVTTDSVLQLATNSALLNLLLRAERNNVAISIRERIQLSDTYSRIRVALMIPGKGTASITLANRCEGEVKWHVQLSSDEGSFDTERTADSGPQLHFCGCGDVGVRSVLEIKDSGRMSATSVADLFGDLIALRDLEPRRSEIAGIGTLRKGLEFESAYTPRKNEPQYAKILTSFIRDLAPDGCSDIIYVGDTIFNDGSAIRNLARESAGRVWGFLCNEKGFGAEADVILGEIYFARRWSSLTEFVRRQLQRGLTIGPRTVALFDLDQTVYAAKGRDDEALHRARAAAIESFLGDVIPAYKFDAKKVETLYRALDRDEFHPVTRDNMDYVVLLVLAVAVGLCDLSDVHRLTGTNTLSLIALTDDLYRKALARSAHEDLGRTVEVLRAVYYNTFAGDQTPCKDFRRFECLFMAAQMGSNGPPPGDASSHIVLNAEVAAFIEFLKRYGCRVMAISDRPLEAAVTEDDKGRITDLMNIAIPLRGLDIYDELCWQFEATR